MHAFLLQAISLRVCCIVGTGDAFAAWANDRKQYCFPTDKCTGLRDYESPDRGMFVVPGHCWGIFRWPARSTCSQTAGQSEEPSFPASFPCTLCSQEQRIALPSLRSSLSGQVVFVWPDFRRQRTFLRPYLCASSDRHLSSRFFLSRLFPTNEVVKRSNRL